MSILDQFNNQDQQQAGNPFVDTLESFGALLFIRWVIHRIIHRHHLKAGIVLLVSAVAAFIVLINSDYGDNSFMVWLFWSLFGVSFLSLAKAIS